MTMDLKDFQRLLDAHGADPAGWPAQDREAALNLVAGSDVAEAMLERAGRLDGLLSRGLAEGAGPDLRRRIVAAASATEAPAARRRPAGRWPLAPWRLGVATAAAASVALGIVVGLEVPAIADFYTASEIATDLTAATYGQFAGIEDIR